VYSKIVMPEEFLN